MRAASEQDGLGEEVSDKFRTCTTYHSLLQYSAELRGGGGGDKEQLEEGQREDRLGHEGEEVNKIT